MRQIVKDYEVICELTKCKYSPLGYSTGPKSLIHHILDNSQNVEVLDIGFGTGELGELIKTFDQTSHWAIDGIDGWEPNCSNKILFDKKYYRNIYLGNALDLKAEQFNSYKIICLLDVIEHLTPDAAKYILRTLLSNMSEDAYLFVSTPLWFMPQAPVNEGDLEEHLIGIPATSMMSLLPVMYAIGHQLVGCFIYSKRSLDYIELFHTVTDKNFNIHMGENLLKIMNMNYSTGTFIKTGF